MSAEIECAAGLLVAWAAVLGFYGVPCVAALVVDRIIHRGER
jgi:hypothetical protein